MKKYWVYLAVAFQLLSVALIAVNREIILFNGEKVLIQTAPIDPRDIFRGDYVRLSYTFNKIQPDLFDSTLTGQNLKKGQRVYLLLQTDAKQVATAVRLQADEPTEGLFLKGRVKYDWTYPTERTRHVLVNPVSVDFGIEKYFVQQGKGLEIEKTRGLHDARRERFQRPMLIKASVASTGDAGLTGFEWGKLGYKTEIIQSPDPKAPEDQASAVIKFTLKNLSDNPLSLPLKAGNCSFELRPAGYDFDADKRLQTGRDHCETQTPQNIILAKDATHAIEFDLNNPAWRFDHGKLKNQPLGKLPWGYRLRIHYADGEIDGLKAEILSRAFHGRGQVD